MSQKGFTLIELSIVLVIIGVVLAGAMKGIAYIELARAKKVITDATTFIDAQHRYRERNQRYAGDTNNDGRIDFQGLGAVALDDAAATGDDADSAFNELKAVNLLPTTLSNATLSLSNENVSFHFAGAQADDAAGNTNVFNMLVIRNASCLSAFQLETNIDKDEPATAGSAATGMVRMITAAGALAAAGQWTSADTACVVDGVVSEQALTSIAFLF